MVKIGSQSTVSLHFEKHKNLSHIFQKHVERVPGQNHSNENIKPERTAENIFLHQPDDKTYKQRFDEIISKHYKKKAKIQDRWNKMVSTTVQIGGDLAENGSEADQIEALKSAYEILKDRYGEQNILSAVIHVDETMPHLHFDFVPLTEEGALSYKQVIGNKQQLIQTQKDFLQAMQNAHPEHFFDRKSDTTLNGVEYKTYQRLTKNLEEEKKELNDWENDLLEEEDRLEKAQDDLKASQETLRASEAALSDREAQVAQKEQKLTLRDSELSQREDRLKSDQDVLKSSQKALRDSESRLANREAQTSKKEKELSEREKELSESKKKADDDIKNRKNHLQKSYDLAINKVNKRDEKLSDRERELSERSDKLDQKADSLAKKSQELSATSDQLKLFQQELDAQKAEQEKIQEEIEEESSLLERLKQEFDQAKNDFLQNLNKLYQRIRKPDKRLWEKTKKSTLFEELDNVIKKPEPETIEKANNTTKSLLNSKNDDDLPRSEADQLGDDLLAGLDDLMNQNDQFQR